MAIIDRVAAHQGWPGLKEELHRIMHGTYVLKELESLDDIHTYMS